MDERDVIECYLSTVKYLILFNIKHVANIVSYANKHILTV